MVKFLLEFESIKNPQTGKLANKDYRDVFLKYIAIVIEGMLDIDVKPVALYFDSRKVDNEEV